MVVLCREEAWVGSRGTDSLEMPVVVPEKGLESAWRVPVPHGSSL